MNADCTKDWDMSTEKGFTFDASTYKLSYTQTKVEGFDYNICMQCSNSHMTAQSKFNIKQYSKCHAKYGLHSHVPVVSTEEAPKVINEFQYDISFGSGEDLDANRTAIGFNETYHSDANNTWIHYFQNADVVNCGYDKCELLAQGCETREIPYTQTEHLTITSEAPWTVHALTNVPDGYSTSFCIKCSNGWDSIKQDDIVVNQAPSTPWMIICIVVFVVILLAFSAGCFLLGK